MINSYDKIMGGLYVGDGISPRIVLQKKEPISHIISLVPINKTLKRMLQKKSIVHIEHLIQNDVNEDIVFHFNELYPQIREILSNKGDINLLIHCDLGRSRSVGIVLLTLIKKYKYKFDQGYELIKLKREVELNPHFYESIKNYKRSKRRIIK